MYHVVSRDEGSLTWIEGPGKGEVFMVSDGETKLGRDPSQVDIVVDDPAVSRVHAVISGPAGRFTLRNLSRTNPTFVNEQRVAETPLEGGETIRLGQTTYRVQIL